MHARSAILDPFAQAAFGGRCRKQGWLVEIMANKSKVESFAVYGVTRCLSEKAAENRGL